MSLPVLGNASTVKCYVTAIIIQFSDILLPSHTMIPEDINDKIKEKYKKKTKNQFNVFPTDVYRKLLSDRKYGLSIQVMATHIMPSLMPQTVNPALNLEQYLVLHEVGFCLAFLLCQYEIRPFFCRCYRKCWTRLTDTNAIN